MPKRKRTFEVFIDARLTVLAFDASSAQRKIERAFSKGNEIDTDVTATGEVWTYDTARREAPTARSTKRVSAPTIRAVARRASASG